jgi:hypothetical protein
MINYYKKEDTLTKYYAKVDDVSKISISVYRNKDGSRSGINIFPCFPTVYSDWSASTMEEFYAKLQFIKETAI